MRTPSLVARERAGGPIRGVLPLFVVDNPAGRYVTSGLLLKAKSPDELAGVIAHELGHQQHRDMLRKLMHDGGVAFLVGLLFGSVTGGAAIIYASKSALTQNWKPSAAKRRRGWKRTSPSPFGAARASCISTATLSRPAMR